jgi:hypothetical protein
VSRDASKRIIPADPEVAEDRGPECRLDPAVERLEIPTTVDRDIVAERHTTTPVELLAVDARLAPPPSSAGREGRPEQPDR